VILPEPESPSLAKPQINPCDTILGTHMLDMSKMSKAV
jgi:hypothetical protein